MRFPCPDCGRPFLEDVFAFGIPCRCACGRVIGPEEARSLLAEAKRLAALVREEIAIRRLQRAADRVALLIVSTDYQKVDIDAETRKLKQLCRELFPEKIDLFRMVYEARLRRLWEQFRNEER